jgi:predicted RNA-binding protein associated with RNAse of E/G family
MDLVNTPLHRLYVDTSSYNAEANKNRVFTSDLTKDVFVKEYRRNGLL